MSTRRRAATKMLRCAVSGASHAASWGADMTAALPALSARAMTSVSGPCQRSVESTGAGFAAA